MKDKDLDLVKIELVLNTKRINRKLDLVDISNKMHKFKDALNSIKAVAEEIGLSERMVSQFLCIKGLPKEIKELIKDRKVDSVDVAYRLSLLPNLRDQIYLASGFIDDELSSKDIREIVTLRRRKPEKRIFDLVKYFEGIKDIKRYKIIIPTEGLNWLLNIRGSSKRVKAIKDKFEVELGHRTVFKAEVFSGLVTVVLTEKGFRKLAKRAREKEVSKTDEAYSILKR